MTSPPVEPRRVRVHVALTERVASRVADHLNRTGSSQATLARAVGVTEASVSRWASGGSLPSTVELVFLANALGTTIDELLLADP